MTDSPAPEPTADTRLDLWRTLRDYIVSAFYILGSPLDLAERAWVRIAQYNGYNSWLFRCEELFRRLLFVDALKLAGNTHAPVPPAKQDAPRSVRVSHLEAFDTEHPESWRVSFQLNSNGPPAPRRQAAKRNASVDWNTTACVYPLARRLEALVRAFNDPDRHVRRMARLLRKHRARLAAAFTRPTRTYMTTNATGGDLACADAADFAKQAYMDSS